MTSYCILKYLFFTHILKRNNACNLFSEIYGYFLKNPNTLRFSKASCTLTYRPLRALKANYVPNELGSIWPYFFDPHHNLRPWNDNIQPPHSAATPPPGTKLLHECIKFHAVGHIVNPFGRQLWTLNNIRQQQNLCRIIQRNHIFCRGQITRRSWWKST